MKRVILYCAASILLQSCLSYRTNFKGAAMKEAFETMPKQEVFVVNKQANKEAYRVLKRSNIYTLTNDSTAVVKIELGRVGHTPQFICFTGIAPVMVITLGQLPIRIPEKYFFEYKEIKANDTTAVSLQLGFTRRLWFWDMFSTKKNVNNILAKEIRYNKIKSTSQLPTASIQPNQKPPHG